MNTISICDNISCDTKFYTDYFYSDGKKVSDNAPKWAMSLRSARSMRFRYDEVNDNRSSFFSSFFLDKKREIASVELIHSKIVYAIETALEIAERKGDGIITQNKELVPAVTVADCMPIFIYDPITKVFGALHSGWKGTGIVEDAIIEAGEKYGAKASDFLVVLGAHIQSCCYLVEKERADYFAEKFTPDCVEDIGSGKYRLSLAKANLAVLKKIGVKDENITLCTDCTSCAKDKEKNYPFGSFRRETGAQIGKPFTVQVAFSYWE